MNNIHGEVVSDIHGLKINHKVLNLNDLILPKWKATEHIEKGWDVLTNIEKGIVIKRVNALFKDNFIHMKTLPIYYLHLFSFLAQVEVLAIQIPLRFMDKFTGQVRKQLRNQLIDEIVHGAIFTKMAYHLALPLGSPVPIVDAAEIMCNEIRNIDDEKLALLSLNLIAEGWIEEVFECLITWGVSDKIFKSILSDEERHVSEAELYTRMGMKDLDPKLIEKNIRSMETSLLEAISTPNVVRSLAEIGGYDKYRHLVCSLFDKHRTQLLQLNLKPSDNWTRHYQYINTFFMRGMKYNSKYEIIEPQPYMKSMFLKVWDHPKNPTIRNIFSLSYENIPNMKYLNSAFIYSLSKFVEKDNYYNSRILSNNFQFIRIKAVNIGVRLLIETVDGPELGTVNLYNVEDMGFMDINSHILCGMKILQFWKNKRIEFMKTYELSEVEKRNAGDDYSHYLQQLPNITSPVPFTISNVGSLGYDVGEAAITSFNPMDFTLGAIKKVPEWDEDKGIFVPQEMFKVCQSADHRIFEPQEWNLKDFKEHFNCFNWRELINEEENNSNMKKELYGILEYINDVNILYETMSHTLSKKSIKRLLQFYASNTLPRIDTKEAIKNL